MPGNTSRRYPPELKERAVRMVAEIQDQHESEWAAMNQVSQLLGIGSGETVRKWVRQAEVDAGRRPGATTEESAELKRLRRENAELKRADAILKAASTFFAVELAKINCGHASTASATRPCRAHGRSRGRSCTALGRLR